jgi:hypothetical protein
MSIFLGGAILDGAARLAAIFTCLATSFSILQLCISLSPPGRLWS